MELPSPLISWINPFPSRVINRTIFFCNALESHECACCLLLFLYFHCLFPLLARETSSGNRSIYKSTRERVDSKGLCGRRRLHLMGSWPSAACKTLITQEMKTTKTATFVYLPTLVNLFLPSMQLSHKSCPRLYIYDTSHSTCHAFITWFQLSLTIHIYCVKCLCWEVLLFVSFMTSTSSFLVRKKSSQFWILMLFCQGHPG